MPSFSKIFFSPRFYDIFFTAGIIGIMAVIWFGADQPIPEILPADQPWQKGAALIGVLLATGLLAFCSARIDQRCSEEFVFTMLAKAAFIGMTVLIMGFAIWTAFFEDKLGALSGFNVLCLALGGWSLGYFFTRISGTSA